MQKEVRKNQIYLSGGGDEKQSFPLDKIFFGNLPENGSLLYIPIALKGSSLYNNAPKWIKKVALMHNRDDLTIEILDNIADKSFKDIKSFNAIYIGGGNTWSLIKEMEESAFSSLIIKYYKSGGQIYGGSAGAIILGKRIDTHNDENIVKWPGFDGLNLLGEYSVACHYRKVDRSIYKNWTNGKKTSIVCLPEISGLIVAGNIARCIGNEPCYVFRPNEDTVEIANEQIFSIK